MSNALIYSPDLKQKVSSVGTQEAFAKKMGMSRIHLGRILNGQRSVPFDLALRSAREFGAISLHFDGVDYEITVKGEDRSRKHLPDLSVDMDPIGGAWPMTKEIQDVEQHMKSLIKHAMDVKLGKCEGRQWVTISTKEVAELVAVGKRYLRAAKDHFPKEWAEGMRLALEELAEAYGIVDVEIGTTSVA